MSALANQLGWLVRAFGMRVHDVVRVCVHAVDVELKLKSKASAHDAVDGRLDDGRGSFVQRGGSDTLVVCRRPCAL